MSATAAGKCERARRPPCTREEEVALLIEAALVAGAEPALGRERVGVGLGVVQVPLGWGEEAGRSRLGVLHAQGLDQLIAAWLLHHAPAHSRVGCSRSAPDSYPYPSNAARLSASAPAHAPAHKGSARCVVVSCMDTRLTTLLPSALGLRPGDAKIIKSAGAIISGPFGGITRSVVIALYELGANEVFVVGHHDCGMAKVDASETMEKMVEHGGIARETLATLTHAGIDVRRWLAGFSSVQQSVKESVALLRNHPLVPRAVPVSGLIIDPDTGKLDLVVDGTLDAGVIAARGGAPLK